MSVQGPAAGRDRAPVAAWLGGLGPLAARRPAPSLAGAVAGAGGALVAAGVIGVAGQRWASTGSAGVAVVLTTALLCASVAAVVRAPAPLAVAAVAASGLAAPTVAFFLSAAVAGGGIPSARGTAVLAAALSGGLYAVGPWRGHSFHMAILVVAAWLSALSLNEVGLGGAFLGGVATLGDVLTGAGLASIATGALYLGAGLWLDRRGLEGMATPFLAVGTMAVPVGTVAVLRDAGDAAGAAGALAAGAVLALAGGRRGRRGTTWIGVGTAAIGLVALAVAVAPDGVVAAALALAAAGAGVVALAPLAGRAVGEPAVAAPAAAPAADPVVPVGADASWTRPEGEAS